MTMRELLLIDLAICAAVIVVAAAVMLRRRRVTDRPLMPVEERPGDVAGRAGEDMAGRGAADVAGSGHDTVERDPGARMPAVREQAAESGTSGAAATDLRSDGAGPEPDEPQAADGTVTVSERVIGYFEEADRPVAGYLAARGWAGEQETPGRMADADAAPAAGEATAEPGTVRKRLAA
jgi:hypothetical protein